MDEAGERRKRGGGESTTRLHVSEDDRKLRGCGWGALLCWPPRCPPILLRHWADVVCLGGEAQARGGRRPRKKTMGQLAGGGEGGQGRKGSRRCRCPDPRMLRRHHHHQPTTEDQHLAVSLILEHLLLLLLISELSPYRSPKKRKGQKSIRYSKSRPILFKIQQPPPSFS